MNEIHHHTYVLTFSSWAPFKKDTIAEMDELRHLLREKKLLAHAANVKLLERVEA